jgi:YVTN family beta-propeller protein
LGKPARNEQAGMTKSALTPVLTILVATSALAACRDTTSLTQPDLQPTISPHVTAGTTRPIRAYVTNVGSDNVSVIDVATNTVVATVPVGNSPLNVALTPDGAFAYVTNSSDRTVSVIDAASNAVVATVGGLGHFPEGIAITPDGAFAYVAIYGSPPAPGSVSVIATASNTVVTTIENVGGAPLEVAVTPDGASVFVTNRLSNDVAVIDVATNTVETMIPVGTYPIGIAFRPDGSTAYVVNEEAATVSAIDVARRIVTTTVDLPGFAFAVAFSPDGTSAYVTIEEDPGSVAVIDLASHTVTGTIPGLGRYPEGIAVTPDGATAYVANTSSSPGSVSVIDLDAGSVLTTVEVGGNPVWVAMTPVMHTGPNRAPIANAGEDQSVYLGDRVQLEGTATDPDDDLIVAWLWTMEDPDVVGDYIIRFVVSDGFRQSEPDFVLIHASDNRPNQAPIANAGENRTIYVGDVAALHGTATDPDGDPIVAWYWTMEDTPEGRSLLRPRRRRRLHHQSRSERRV